MKENTLIQKLVSGAVVATALTLTACATTTGNQNQAINDTTVQVGKAVLITAVDAKCRTEIQKQSQWATIGRLMSSENRAAWEGKICSCASTEAVNSTSLTDMVLVANPSTRDAAVANIAQRTITSCVKKLSVQ